MIIPRLKWPWILILSFGAILLICFLAWVYLLPAFHTLSPPESALNETRQLLTAVETNPVGSMPNDLPGYLRVNDDCWAFLQQSMIKNANQYKLMVTSEYDSDNDPQAVHEFIEVYLNIDFPDGKHAEMYYSQGGLSFCHEK